MCENFKWKKLLFVKIKTIFRLAFELFPTLCYKINKIELVLEQESSFCGILATDGHKWVAARWKYDATMRRFWKKVNEGNLKHLQGFEDFKT